MTDYQLGLVIRAICSAQGARAQRLSTAGLPGQPTKLTFTDITGDQEAHMNARQFQEVLAALRNKPTLQNCRVATQLLPDGSGVLLI